MPMSTTLSTNSRSARPLLRLQERAMPSSAIAVPPRRFLGQGGVAIAEGQACASEAAAQQPVAIADDTDAVDGPSSSSSPSLLSIDSTSLLQGGKCVRIAHNGSIYRLQATKLGKLILTK